MILKFNTNLSSGTSVALPLHGVVDVTVDWGDGTENVYNTAGNRTKTYATEGEYTVTISGSLEQFGNGFETYTNAAKLIRVDSWGDIGLTSLAGAFRDAVNLEEVPNELPVNMQNLTGTFWGATNFNSDISEWNTSQVGSMMGTFYFAPAFNQDIGGWEVGNVTNMSFMFQGASSFNQDLNDWDVSQVTTMQNMFTNAYSFNGEIGSWDVREVTNMNYMFYNDVVNNPPSAFNQNISAWRTEKVTNMEGMFWGAVSFNQDLPDWDVSEVTNMQAMFMEASSFNGRLDNWDVGKVKDMSFMFNRASSFNRNLFTQQVNPNGTPYWAWNVSGVENMRSMFNATENFNGDISNWDISSVTDISFMFRNSFVFNQDISTKTIEEGPEGSYVAWDIGNGKISSFQSLFLRARKFNQPIGNWDVSNIETMIYAFDDAQDFNQDLSGWDVSKVQIMHRMFRLTQNFNQDIGKWDVSNVTDMSQMFEDATAFNQNLSYWNVTHIEEEPEQFSTGALSWTKPQPLWGQEPNPYPMIMIYKKNNYIIIKFIDGGLLQAHSKNVFIKRDNRDKTLFYIFGVPGGFKLETEGVRISDVINEAGLNYSINDWVAFYRTNTGN